MNYNRRVKLPLCLVFFHKIPFTIRCQSHNNYSNQPNQTMEDFFICSSQYSLRSLRPKAHILQQQSLTVKKRKRTNVFVFSKKRERTTSAKGNQDRNSVTHTCTNTKQKNRSTRSRVMLFYFHFFIHSQFVSLLRVFFFSSLSFSFFFSADFPPFPVCVRLSSSEAP